MYKKTRSILSEDMIKVPFLNGIATVIRMFTGLISVKIVANIIGPSGIAMVGQLNNISQILMNLSNGGINTGIVKYLSENKEDTDTCKGYVSTGIKITITLSIIIGAIVLLFYRKITNIVFHDESYKFVIIILAFSIIFFAVNAFLTSLLNGYQEYNKYIYVNICGSITGLIFSVILAVYYGLKGALIASITYQSVVFGITLYLTRTSIWYQTSFFNSRFRFDLTKKLSQFSLMAIVSAITVPGSQFIARSFIVKYQSVYQAGLWEGINRVSGIYLMVITTSLAVYYLPKISQLKNAGEIRSEVGKVYKLMVPFLIASSLALFLLRNFITHLLFSKEFFEMESLYAIQMTAESIKICGYLLGYILMAKTMTKAYIYLEMQNFVLLGVFNFFLVKKYGTWGASLSHALAYTLYLLVGLYLLRNILLRSPKYSS